MVCVPITKTKRETMFGTIKDAYDKYVTMELRFNELAGQFNELRVSISELEKYKRHIFKSDVQCECCRDGVVLRHPVENAWICDTCGAYASWAQDRKLTNKH